MVIALRGRHRAPAITAAVFITAISPTRADSTDDLWPLQLGNTWTTQMSINNSIVTQVVTVTRVTPGKDSSIASLEYRSGGTSVLKETYRSNAQGLFRLAGGADGSSKITPGLPILQYPMAAGGKWSWNGSITAKGKATSATAVMTSSGPETLKLPAGTFQAFKVHVDLTVLVGKRQVTYPNDYWFARGVGLVRQKATIGGTEIESSIIHYEIKPKQAGHP